MITGHLASPHPLPALSPLLLFLLGYAAILAIPGPNLLAVGLVSALRGPRGAAPLCAGIALGAATLAAAIALTLEATARLPGLPGTLHGIGALLLLGTAASLAWPRPATPAPQLPTPGTPAEALPARFRAEGLMAFGAGFCTAVANPVTTSFFAGAFAQLRAEGSGLVPLAIPGVALTALLFFLGIAQLLSRPLARRAALAWQRPLRLGAATLLAVLATAILVRPAPPPSPPPLVLIRAP